MGVIRLHPQLIQPDLFTIHHLRFTMLLMPIPSIEENDQTRARQDHLEALRQLVGNVYPNKFERSHTVDPLREDTITALVEKYRAFEPEAHEGERPAPEAIELANQQLNPITV